MLSVLTGVSSDTFNTSPSTLSGFVFTLFRVFSIRDTVGVLPFDAMLTRSLNITILSAACNAPSRRNCPLTASSPEIVTRIVVLDVVLDLVFPCVLKLTSRDNERSICELRLRNFVSTDSNISRVGVKPTSTSVVSVRKLGRAAINTGTTCISGTTCFISTYHYLQCRNEKPKKL